MTRRGAACGPAAQCVAAAALALLAGCSPAFDWRQARPEGSGVTMLFPCRPDRHVRDVRLDGRVARMQVDSCSAAAVTFSLAAVDAGGPGEVTPLLATLRAVAAANVAASAPEPATLHIPGATPNPQSAIVRLSGRLPDGRPVSLHAAFFVKGLRLYQASAIGESIPGDASDTFFEAIRFAP